MCWQRRRFSIVDRMSLRGRSPREGVGPRRGGRKPTWQSPVKKEIAIVAHLHCAALRAVQVALIRNNT